MSAVCACIFIASEELRSGEAARSFAELPEPARRRTPSATFWATKAAPAPGTKRRVGGVFAEARFIAKEKNLAELTVVTKAEQWWVGAMHGARQAPTGPANCSMLFSFFRFTGLLLLFGCGLRER